MSSEMQTILNDIGARFGVAIDDTMLYMQSLIERYAQYKCCVHGIVVILSVITIGVAIRLLHLSSKGEHEYDVEVLLLAGIILAAIALLVFGLNLNAFFKALFLPEMMFIEYIKGLMN